MTHGPWKLEGRMIQEGRTKKIGCHIHLERVPFLNLHKDPLGARAPRSTRHTGEQSHHT